MSDAAGGSLTSSCRGATLADERSANMTRHYIKDEDGNDQRDEHGHRTFWSDKDGDTSPDRHQTVYHETDHGSEEDKDVHYNPSDGTFHKK
jgi:hypothetical protein